MTLRQSGMILFAIADAEVLPDGTIDYPKLRDQTEGPMIAKDAAGVPQVKTLGVAHCNCGRRLEFLVPPGCRIPMPYDVDGWRFAWAPVVLAGSVAPVQEISVVCDACLAEHLEFLRRTVTDAV